MPCSPPSKIFEKTLTFLIFIIIKIDLNECRTTAAAQTSLFLSLFTQLYSPVKIQNEIFFQACQFLLSIAKKLWLVISETMINIIYSERVLSSIVFFIKIFLMCKLSVNNFQFLFVENTFYHSQNQLIAGSQPGGIWKALWNYLMWQYFMLFKLCTNVFRLINYNYNDIACKFQPVKL